MERGHLVSHVSVVGRVYGSCQLEVLDLRWIHFQTVNNRGLKTARYRIANDNIFPCIIPVRVIVRLPGAYADAGKFYLILTRRGLLAQVQVEGGDLARKVLRRDIAHELTRNAINRDHKHRLPSLHSLRHDDSPVLAVVVHRHDAGKRSLSVRSHYTGGKVDGGLADSVGDENRLGCRGVLLVTVPTGAFGEAHTRARHYMSEG